MIQRNHLRKTFKRFPQAWVFFSLYLFVSSAYAANFYDQISVTTMIKNLAEQLPELMLFVTALAYVLGFYSIFTGIMQLKKFAESRSMMSQEHSIKGPLLYIFAGAAMIYLPSTVQSGLTSFWLNPNPYGYEEAAGSEWNDLYIACITIIQLIGVIAFLRGLVILSHLGGQGGGQQGQFGRAAAHIVGGIFLIDIFDFLRAIFATLGLGSLLPS